jgi:hypothetical protein
MPSLKELERDLYLLINNIDYHGENYSDYKTHIEELENNISLLKALDNF